MNSLKTKSWSPYVVGALIGMLSWFAFATADRPIGITTAFENTAALAEKAASRHKLRKQRVFLRSRRREAAEDRLGMDAGRGGVLGAFVSSKLSGDRTDTDSPAALEVAIWPSAAKRFAGAFFGGGADDVWGAPRAGLHERSRHQRRPATRSVELDLWSVDIRDGVAVTFLIFGKKGANHV